MKKMKGAILPGNSTVELKEFDIPTPGHGEVLIKMKSSTICGSSTSRRKNRDKARCVCLGVHRVAVDGKTGWFPLTGLGAVTLGVTFACNLGRGCSLHFLRGFHGDGRSDA